MALTSFSATVLLQRKPIEPKDIFELLVEADLDQPDMAAITLSNTAEKPWSSEIKLGAEIEVKVSPLGHRQEDPVSIFKGEVTGVEPIWVTGEGSRVVVRALNALHRLARGRKTKTYVKMKDSQIVANICSAAQLTADCEETKVKHDHVFQHNQTDLEFIRQRAARSE